MARSFPKRRQDRIGRILNRIEFLEGRIREGGRRDPARDKAEVSALKWALEEIERFDLVEAALSDDTLDEGGKLHAIAIVVNARYEPTEADIQRTKQLAEQYGWTQI
jgi:hypothetical protein